MINNKTGKAGWLLLMGCALIQTQVIASTPARAVGPSSHGAYDNATSGYLVVYSRTEQTQAGDGAYYYPHTSYSIYDAEGKKMKTVGNHDSAIDETPEKVELAPGNYTVKAWSENDGLVAIPVIIKLADTTTVNLESDGGRSK